MNDFIEEHGGAIAIGVIAAIALASQLPTIGQSMNRAKLTAQANQSRLQENQLQQAEKLALQASRDEANARYDSGCEVITTLRSPTIAAPIQEGKPIVAGTYAKQFNPRNPNPDHYLGRDVVVCDLYGTTAITRWDESLGYAVARSIAVTNDRDRMARAKERRPGIKRPNLTN